MGALKTDWDAYYDAPGALTGITRRITTRRLLACLRRYRGTFARARVLEFGGANSCFHDAVRAELAPAAYDIVDDNRRGLERFAARHPDLAGSRLIERDVRDAYPEGAEADADLCFSVGLIEHFDERGTREVIRCHFRAVRDGGLVVLFFPTPTWLYRTIRRAAEALGVWAFPDERPLAMAEVVGEAERHGRVLATDVNWWIGLTQGIVVTEVARPPRV
jgi:SAM-dependent methyltransferase